MVNEYVLRHESASVKTGVEEGSREVGAIGTVAVGNLVIVLCAVLQVVELDLRRRVRRRESQLVLAAALAPELTWLFHVLEVG